MTINEAKTELREYRILSEKIITLQIKLINARTKITGGSRDMSSVEEKLQELICRATDMRKKVEAKIALLDEPYGKILHEKYIRNKTLLYISTSMCYEYTWMCKLHKRALEMYCRL